MKEISNQSSICYKRIMDSSKKSNDEVFVYTSPIGKVQYKVLKQSAHMFEVPIYTRFFELLYALESKLDEKLPFDIELDFITLEAFRKAEQDGIMPTVIEILGTNLFYLVNDITVQNTAIRSVDIIGKYLYKTALINLNEFYNTKRKTVLECFERDFSSLYLYEIIYNDNRSRENTLGNLYSIILDESESSIRREFAEDLLVQFTNNFRATLSETSRDDLCNAMYRINQHMDAFTDKLIKKLPARDILTVYDTILREK